MLKGHNRIVIVAFWRSDCGPSASSKGQNEKVECLFRHPDTAHATYLKRFRSSIFVNIVRAHADHTMPLLSEPHSLPLSPKPFQSIAMTAYTTNYDCHYYALSRLHEQIVELFITSIRPQLLLKLLRKKDYIKQFDHEMRHVSINR